MPSISYVCFECRKSFKRLSASFMDKLKCPNCGKDSHNVGKKFKAPKMTDDKGWELTKFLFKNGFNFYSLYEDASHEVSGRNVFYPKTMDEAKEFVKKYKQLRK